jgi:hypothetical protein
MKPVAVDSERGGVYVKEKEMFGLLSFTSATEMVTFA